MQFPAPSLSTSASPARDTADVAEGAWPGWVHGLVLALFAISALIGTGYGFATNDASNYMPLTWIRLEPGLYPTDEVFGWIRDSSWARHAAFFSTMTAALARLAPLEWVAFWLHSVCLWALFAAWWRIGRAIGGPLIAYLALALLAVSQPIGGTMVLTVPHEFQPRVVGAMLAFWAVAELVDGGRLRLAALLAGLAALFHPISALMAMPLVALAPFLLEGTWPQRLRRVAVAVALMLGPLLLWRVFNVAGPLTDAGLTTTVSAQWQAIMDYRLQGQAVNVTAWRPVHWAAVLVPTVIGMLALRERGFRPVDRLLALGGGAAIALAALGIFATEVLRSSMFSQLMLSRLLFMPMVLGTLYGAWYLTERYRRQGAFEKPWALFTGASLALGVPALAAAALVPLALAAARWRRSAVAASLGVVALLVAMVGAREGWGLLGGAARTFAGYFNQPPVLPVLLVMVGGCAALAAARTLRGPAWLLPLTVAAAPVLLVVAAEWPSGLDRAYRRLSHGVEAPWRQEKGGLSEVAYWARAHTPVETRFLAPFFEPGFRAMAKRGIVTDWKDGGLTLFSEELARRWMAVQREVSVYEAIDADRLRALAHRYECRYAILPAKRALGLPVAFRNAGFVVYDLRP